MCKIKQQTLTTLPPGANIFNKLPMLYLPHLKKIPKLHRQNSTMILTKLTMYMTELSMKISN
jgi:hypothetical protein